MSKYFGNIKHIILQQTFLYPYRKYLNTYMFINVNNYVYVISTQIIQEILRT